MVEQPPTALRMPWASVGQVAGYDWAKESWPEKRKAENKLKIIIFCIPGSENSI